MKPSEAIEIKRSLVIITPPKNILRKTIVVLGVERGGTSMVGGVIRALGVNFGDRTGRNHENPKFLSQNHDDLKIQIESNNNEYDLWGFKLPKASLMIDFYSNNLRNPHFIVVFRNIAAIADSWNVRDGTDFIDTINHSIRYYDRAINDIVKNKKPLLIVNYERACANKEEFISGISDFIGIDLSDELMNKCLHVISGDGGGYIDIPEYYFHVSSIENNITFGQEYPYLLENDKERFSEFSKKNERDLLVLLPSDQFFPNDFLVSFSLKAEKQILKEDGLRFYMDFRGEFFPGHAFRPPVQNGKNIIRCESNGNIKRIAFGGLRSNLSFAISNINLYLLPDNFYDIAKKQKNSLLRKIKKSIEPVAKIIFKRGS